MQDLVRTNQERSDTTRAALMAAARALFVEKGYAQTSTPEIATAAGITRGALYHHFADKQALFRAIIELEMQAVADEIERVAPTELAPLQALLAGSEAYIAAMANVGRTRLLLIEAPAVLGSAALLTLDEAHAGRTLVKGLQAAFAVDDKIKPAQVEILADLLSAAFDRAALAIEAGASAKRYRKALAVLIERLVAP